MDKPLPPLPRRTVVDVITVAAEQSPDATAVRDRTQHLTYHQLLQEARAVAGGLHAHGVSPGDAVLIMLDNHVDFVLAWLGTATLGAIEVPINTAYKGLMLAHQIRDSGASVLIVEAEYAHRVNDIITDIPALRTIIVRGQDDRWHEPQQLTRHTFDSIRAQPPLVTAPPSATDLMAIMYTSGTTGPSKGVRVTHAHAYGYCTPALYGAASTEDTVLVVLPLFHIGGQWAGVYNALTAGAECVILDRFHVSTYWDDVREFGCTYTLLLGAMATFLFNKPASANDRTVPLRRALMVPAIAQVEEFSERFDCKIATAYGSTEASTPLYTAFGEAQYGTCGTLRPDFEARLVDADDIEVEPGTAGELVLRSHEPWTLMDGYHQNPSATANAWRNQWLHTGDAFIRDDDGHYRFVDRTKDALRRRGENISSFEVEAGAVLHPDVVECAAVGVRSAHTEQEILLVVKKAPHSILTAPELIDFMNDRLPKFMVPRYIRFTDELPRTPTQKIKKNELRSQGLTPDTWDRERSGNAHPTVTTP